MIISDSLLIPGGKLTETAIALGVFDGVHVGHQAVINEAVKEKKNGLLPVVMAFDMTSTRPAHKRGQQFILTQSLKEQRMEQLGASVYLNIPFERVRDLSPEYFVKEILIAKLHAKKVICGFDFRFGKNAAGTVEMLQKICLENGADAAVIPPMNDGDKPVSSTRIRYCLMQGELQAANRMLGRPYAYDMVVIDGMKNGRRLGFPTINQEFSPGFLVPKFGVYASKVLVDGKWYGGVTNIGVKPTISGSRNPLGETFIIGLNQNLYGRKITVCLLDFLREEKKFDSLEELSETVHQNILTVEKMMKEILKTEGKY